MPGDPLAGVRVLDLTIALAGPYCTMLLGDLGADVVKVESPEGDQSRGWGPPFVEGESSYFLSVNRNKRSVVLDLKSDDGRRAAAELAARSDVIVENLRPGTVARLGLGYEQVRERNTGVVYCSISGFGQDRPAVGGYDQIVQGTAGVMSLTGEPDGPPTKFGVPIGDIAAGMFGAHAILAALLARTQAGEGRHIDVAMHDSVLALLTYQGARYFATGEAPRREGNFHPTIAPYGTFETADGFINIGVGSEAQWKSFCAATGLNGLVADPRFATNRDRQANRAVLNEAVGRRIRERSSDQWQRELEAAGVPVGPINDLAQAFADPGTQERGIEVVTQHPRVGEWHMVGTPWRLDRQAFAVRRPPPMLGEHTAEILRELELAD
jgi:crotonobetainyl-CoA:carnitine CoA-transferase CaiB-like acyl-CoA transferase